MVRGPVLVVKSDKSGAVKPIGKAEIHFIERLVLE
jgi:hypothetical protein